MLQNEFFFSKWTMVEQFDKHRRTNATDKNYKSELLM